MFDQSEYIMKKTKLEMEKVARKYVREREETLRKLKWRICQPAGRHREYLYVRPGALRRDLLDLQNEYYFTGELSLYTYLLQHPIK